jgi:hypothetical protein
MKFTMDIWMEGGETRLGLINTETGDIMHLWQLNKIPQSMGSSIPTRCLLCKSRANIQHFVRKLFLFSLKDVFSKDADPSLYPMDPCQGCEAQTQQQAVNSFIDKNASDLAWARTRQTVARK